MNKAFEKILERFDAKKQYFQKFYEADGKTKEDECINKATQLAFDDAKNIVQEVAEEYNNGQIACSERLPEEKINPITKDYYVYPVTYRNENIEDVRYYSYGNGHWHHCLQIMDDFVVAWQPLPEPFKEGNANVESNQKRWQQS